MKNKITIRPLKAEDANISWAWRNNPEVWKLTGKRPVGFISREIEKEWINNAILDNRSKRFAIIAYDGKYIGNVQITDIEPEQAQFHIFIGETDYWGKGIGKSAAELLISWVKDNTKIKSIWLKVSRDHVAAINLYLSLGFIECDVFNDNNMKQMRKYI